TEINRDGEEKLPEEEDAKRAIGEKGGHDKGLIRVQPSQVPKDDVCRDHGDLKRDHQCRQHNEEQGIPEGEAEKREAIRHKRAGEHRAKRWDDGDDEAVSKEEIKGNGPGPRLYVVGPHDGSGDEW